mgnify:CR=1 FL=1
MDGQCGLRHCWLHKVGFGKLPAAFSLTAISANNTSSACPTSSPSTIAATVAVAGKYKANPPALYAAKARPGRPHPSAHRVAVVVATGDVCLSGGGLADTTLPIQGHDASATGAGTTR